MIDFLITHKNNTIKTDQKSIWLDDQWQLFLFGNQYQIEEQSEEKIILIGDSIDPVSSFHRLTGEEIFKKPGHFYVITIQKESIKIYNSLFSMMPIYYYKQARIVSSSISLIKEYSKNSFTLDKKFILENLLFNYGFFNRSLFEEIRLLPTHTSVILQKGEISFHKCIDIAEDLFGNSDPQTKYDANQLSDLFIKTTQKYFPEQLFQIAFTSGFDGRTLVSCATHNHKAFETFSVGKPENDDVSIPKRNANSLKIPYRFFNLGESVYLDEYFNNALEYTTQGYLGNGFLYAHFLYSTKEITKTASHLLSGACGSELFRALHNTGAVTSQALVDLFRLEDDLAIKEALMNAQPLKVLNLAEFSNELEELIDEVIHYKKELPTSLTPNQSFYFFVFEEIFRKFFGQWIYMQQKYIRVRTPYLDYEFVKALLSSKYAGANNDFFTKNPFKRMKGQYIYADIIKKTNRKIFCQKTGKGYRPADVRYFWNRYRVLMPFVQKRLKRKVAKTYLDNLGIISGIQKNKDAIKDLFSQDEVLFRNDFLKTSLDNLTPYTNEKERDILLMSVALLYNIKSDQTTIKNEDRELINSIDRL